VIKDEMFGNNINFVYGILEVAHIPINFQLRALGVDKITISKCYFIIEFDNGYHIFINDYYDYADIYDQMESEFSDTCLMSDEIVSEILKFFKDESKTIKKIIKNFRSWNR
jgi:hypothetical protein